MGYVTTPVVAGPLLGLLLLIAPAPAPGSDGDEPADAEAPAAEAAAQPFRTDADIDADDTPPWYQVEPGVFPPEGSAHYFSGELIALDHVNRTGVLRTDRTDRQNRSHWDLPVFFTLLPYASMSYHNAPAALRDIPIGTRLHGLFYLKDEDDPGLTPPPGGRVSIEVDFNRAFQLEDDFTHHTRHGRAWRVDEIDEQQTTVLLTPVVADNPEQEAGEPKSFEIVPSTRVGRGAGFATIDDIEAGAVVQINLTRTTLFGPGRCLDIWLDEESRELARERQRQRHLQHMRERGLPGWIDEVDNQQRILTITLFGGIDEELLEPFTVDTNVAVVVAETSLRPHDPVNDRKFGPILEVEQVNAGPGSSGVRIRCRPEVLLEGYRPRRIVRLYPGEWPVTDLPREERLWPDDVAIPLAPTVER